MEARHYIKNILENQVEVNFFDKFQLLSRPDTHSEGVTDIRDSFHFMT